MLEFLKTLGIIVVTVIAFFAATGILIPYISKKGVNIGGILTTTNTTLDIIKGITDQLTPILGNNKYFNVVKMVVDMSEKGVDYAEQLYITSKIPAEQRKEKAVEFVHEALNLSGIEVTEQINSIIDGAVEAAVLVLPKTSEALVEKTK